MTMLYAVNHTYGASLFEARSPQSALKAARDLFGEYGGPYRLPDDQKQAIAWAQSMGASVHEVVPKEAA